MNSYKVFYRLMGLLIGSFAFAVGAYALEQSIITNGGSLLLSVAVLGIFISCITSYRFLYGKKKGHLIIFSYLIIAFLVNIEGYLVVTGGLDWIAGPLMGLLAAMTVFVLASILRLTNDADYFKKYFDEGMIYK